MLDKNYKTIIDNEKDAYEFQKLWYDLGGLINNDRTLFDMKIKYWVLNCKLGDMSFDKYPYRPYAETFADVLIDFYGGADSIYLKRIFFESHELSEYTFLPIDLIIYKLKNIKLNNYTYDFSNIMLEQ